MFAFEIHDPLQYLVKKDVSLLRKIARLVYQEEKLQGKIIFELHIVNPEQSQKINAQYRNKNVPTDVLAFALWDNGELKTALLGEIFLNYPQTVAQAQTYQHSFARELGFLFSHGLFHLLGYDHQIATEAQIMFGKQEKVLQMCNLTRH